MKIKTSELVYPNLDWAVEVCEGYGHNPNTPNFSGDWSQGGPIIERELIGLRDSGGPGNWHASFDRMRLTHDGRRKHYHHQFGATPLIAAMRCYVASKLGDEVDVPDEFLA